jgi:hypothetical protein
LFWNHHVVFAVFRFSQIETRHSHSTTRDASYKYRIHSVVAVISDGGMLREKSQHCPPRRYCSMKYETASAGNLYIYMVPAKRGCTKPPLDGICSNSDGLVLSFFALSLPRAYPQNIAFLTVQHYDRHPSHARIQSSEGSRSICIYTTYRRSPTT